MKRIREFIARKLFLLRRIPGILLHSCCYIQIWRRGKVSLEGDCLVVRSHHLFCLTRYNVLGGYHPTLPLVLTRIKSTPDTTVKVVTGADDICLPCPCWHDDRCKRGMEEANLLKDKQFLHKMDLDNGTVVPAKMLFDIMRKTITEYDLAEICPSCTFEACAEALRTKSWWE